MGATTGLAVIGTYPHDGTDVAVLKALIPNPDVAPSQAGGGMLDEMSPGAAAQLRVELDAMVVDGAAFRVGSHIVTAAEVTATQADIVTGLANITLANCVIAIERAGVNVTRDSVISEPVAGTIRVKAGVNYVLTADDVIRYYAE